VPLEKSEYCAYRYYSADIERSRQECVIAMFTACFDDSGTDGNSDIAVAACYIPTKRGWDEFVDAWDTARHGEGFDCFHLSDFMAPPGQKKEPVSADLKRNHSGRFQMIHIACSDRRETLIP
jgi:hypothetical protein